MMRLFVPGNPAPQGSKSFKGIRGGKAILTESSKECGPWRERIALVAHGAKERIDSGPVAVTLAFTMPRPVSTPKRSTPPAVKRPDLDKLARACLDALSGIAFKDDSQVTYLLATKRLAEIAETPGVFISWSKDAPPSTDPNLGALIDSWGTTGPAITTTNEGRES